MSAAVALPRCNNGTPTLFGRFTTPEIITVTSCEPESDSCVFQGKEPPKSLWKIRTPEEAAEFWKHMNAGADAQQATAAKTSINKW
eukprot:876334-Prorocentrum_minimum.AAC.4